MLRNFFFLWIKSIYRKKNRDPIQMKRTQHKISPQLTEPENRHNCKYQKPSRDECVIFQHAESKSYSEPIYIYICTRKKKHINSKNSRSFVRYIQQTHFSYPRHCGSFQRETHQHNKTYNKRKEPIRDTFTRYREGNALSDALSFTFGV